MIEEKEQYTFEELCEGLEISMSKFAKLADVDEGTIARIRKGHFVRIGTINRLLRALNEVYGRKFTTENVTGLKRVEKPIKVIDEKAEKPSVLPSEVPTTRVVTEKPQKRVYSRKQKDTGLPDGCVLASKFAEDHGVKRPTFYAHMTEGLGPGLIGMSTDTIPQRDRVDYSERPKPNRPGENEKYLDQDQQREALEFWQRHDVAFTKCNTFGCYCHEVLEKDI